MNDKTKEKLDSLNLNLTHLCQNLIKYIGTHEVGVEVPIGYDKCKCMNVYLPGMIITKYSDLNVYNILRYDDIDPDIIESSHYIPINEESNELVNKCINAQKDLMDFIIELIPKSDRYSIDISHYPEVIVTINQETETQWHNVNITFWVSYTNPSNAVDKVVGLCQALSVAYDLDIESGYIV